MAIARHIIKIELLASVDAEDVVATSEGASR
jgi:hypothetical protein